MKHNSKKQFWHNSLHFCVISPQIFSLRLNAAGVLWCDPFYPQCQILPPPKKTQKRIRSPVPWPRKKKDFFEPIITSPPLFPQSMSQKYASSGSQPPSSLLSSFEDALRGHLPLLQWQYEIRSVCLDSRPTRWNSACCRERNLQLSLLLLSARAYTSISFPRNLARKFNSFPVYRNSVGILSKFYYDFLTKSPIQCNSRFTSNFAPSFVGKKDAAFFGGQKCCCVGVGGETEWGSIGPWWLWCWWVFHLRAKTLFFDGGGRGWLNWFWPSSPPPKRLDKRLNRGCYQSKTKMPVAKYSSIPCVRFPKKSLYYICCLSIKRFKCVFVFENHFI